MCVLDSEGAKCLGSVAPAKNGFAPTNQNYTVILNTNIPHLKGVRGLRITDKLFCFLYSEGAYCTGESAPALYSRTSDYVDKHQSTDVTEFYNQNTREFGHISCSQSDSGTYCRGMNYQKNGKGNPIESYYGILPFEMDGTFIYLLWDGQITKYDMKQGRDEVIFSYSFKDVKSFSVTDGILCARTVETVECHGMASPTNITYSKNIEKMTSLMSGVSNPLKSKFLKEFSNLYSTLLVKNAIDNQKEESYKKLGRALFTLLLGPSIRSNDSEHFVTKVYPFYAEVLKDNERFGVRTISDVDAIKLTRLIALKAIQISLNVSAQFLNSKEREQISELTRLLGSAIASPAVRGNLALLLNELDKQNAVLNKLLDSKRSAFLAETIQLATEHLKSF